MGAGICDRVKDHLTERQRWKEPTRFLQSRRNMRSRGTLYRDVKWDLREYTKETHIHARTNIHRNTNSSCHKVVKRWLLLSSIFLVLSFVCVHFLFKLINMHFCNFNTIKNQCSNTKAKHIATRQWKFLLWCY